MTNAGFLAVLKTHSHDLTIMKQNLPSGALGQVALQLIDQAEAAVSSNTQNGLNNFVGNGQVDTYCGVDGNGKPLPSYFNRGKGTAFCRGFIPIFDGVANAGPNMASVLAVFETHKAKVNQLASEVSTLPKSIRAKATATVSEARAIIAANNPETITLQALTPALTVAVYCGKNL
jgi:hypothetical protein